MAVDVRAALPVDALLAVAVDAVYPLPVDAGAVDLYPAVGRRVLGLVPVHARGGAVDLGRGGDEGGGGGGARVPTDPGEEEVLGEGEGGGICHRTPRRG
uniref:Uncharacterized protein n=1 Tax=Arundo donax TaxID=35708 RepID=A0A0A9GHG7_ARUDO